LSHLTFDPSRIGFFQAVDAAGVRFPPDQAQKVLGKGVEIGPRGDVRRRGQLGRRGRVGDDDAEGDAVGQLVAVRILERPAQEKGVRQAGDLGGRRRRGQDQDEKKEDGDFFHDGIIIHRPGLEYPVFGPAINGRTEGWRSAVLAIKLNGRIEG